MLVASGYLHFSSFARAICVPTCSLEEGVWEDTESSWDAQPSYEHRLPFPKDQPETSGMKGGSGANPRDRTLSRAVRDRLSGCNQHRLFHKSHYKWERLSGQAKTQPQVSTATQQLNPCDLGRVGHPAIILTLKRYSQGDS